MKKSTICAALAAAVAAGATFSAVAATRYMYDIIDDVRVAPLVETSWGQGDSGVRGAYNYYTPSNYVCGCVATAGSQIMRYWRFPTAAVEAGTFTCAVDSVPQDFTMKGGTYDWANMPTNYVAGTTTDTEAIGKLTYDVGVAITTDWKASGGGSQSANLLAVFTNTFGYASAAIAGHASGTGVATLMNGIRLAVDSNGGTSVVTVHDGGRIRTSSITKGANGTVTLTFDGGTLEPLGDVEGLLDGMPLTIGSKGFVVDTAEYNVTFGNFTLTSGGELVKEGAGTLTITNSPALDAIAVKSGTLDLGGNAHQYGVLSGAGNVTNGTLAVTGAVRVKTGEHLTFQDVALTVSGAQVEIIDSENMTDSDPVLVAVSNQPISGRMRTALPNRVV